MKRKFTFFIYIFFTLHFVHAQQKLEGKVMKADVGGADIGLEGANIYWLNSPIGTVTNKNGVFSIPYKKEYDKLVIGHIGFQTDTLTINGPEKVRHWLQPTNALDEVVVENKREAVSKILFSTQNVVTINSDELLKAACCNLSESFETNPTIDVNFNNAITGTKQIQLLGLTSPYLLITQENIPMVRGASQAFGLTFIPGTWVESIQVTKGAGSVVNGYESISGQINTELVKPFTNAPLFVNGYANLNGRLELNTHINHKLSNKLATGIYVHANAQTVKVDNNGDGFLDVPLSTQINLQNRWQYQNPEKGWVSFLGVHYVNDDKQLGQKGFEPDTDKFTLNAWGGELATQQFNGSFKLGYVFPGLPFQSFGFQMAYGHHDQESYYGFNQYDIVHKSAYSNLIFNSIIGSTQHKFKTGLTLAYDDYDELVNNVRYARTDGSLGAFFEYSYTNLERLSLTAGLRFDSHNRLGEFVTPRVHLRYTPWDRASLRGSFGMGRRAANFLAENQRFFASSRTLVLQSNNGPVYGFEPEEALNFGGGFLQKFTLFNRPGDFSIDFYRTDFNQQVVVDWENPDEIVFSNLEGKSYANSLQVELNHEVLPRLKLRTAYKFYDVKTQYQSGLLQQPLVAQRRFFANLDYQTNATATGGQWRFDYTLNAIGKQRLPNTQSNPEAFRLADVAKGYALMNAQVTKVFSEKIECYVGGENVTNYKQPNPILGAMNPFGSEFDTTIVYAPILGRMIYAGFRYKL